MKIIKKFLSAVVLILVFAAGIYFIINSLNLTINNTRTNESFSLTVQYSDCVECASVIVLTIIALATLRSELKN